MTSDRREPIPGATAPHGRLHPIAPNERVAAVDILRGLAIFGILAVNVYLYSHPYQLNYVDYLKFTGANPQGHVADRVVHEVINFFFEDAIYCLFAFLFAFGTASLMARAERTGTPFVGLYVRRLLVLLAIGVCHVVFLWAGDILISYALIGFVLLLFRTRTDAALLAWAGVCLSITTIGLAGLVAFVNFRPPAEAATASRPTGTAATSSASSAPTTSTAPATMAPVAGELPASIRKWIRWTCETYSGGSYRRTVLARIADYVTWTVQLLFIQYPRILGMFLLGLYAGRRGILWDIPVHLGLIRKAGVWSLALGIVGSIATIVGTLTNRHGMLSWPGVLSAAGDAVRLPAMALAMAAGVVLLVRNNLWRGRLSPLASVGRMSLSNYLFQSLVCTTIFYGYGFGLFGKIGPTAGLLLAIAIFVVQIPISVWWLRHFRFGPVEWLWRTLTYGERQPMRG